VKDTDPVHENARLLTSVYLIPLPGQYGAVANDRRQGQRQPPSLQPSKKKGNHEGTKKKRRFFLGFLLPDFSACCVRVLVVNSWMAEAVIWNEYLPGPNAAS
jgi:hypothetical protein